MIVTKVTASLKCSKQMDGGVWKTLEFGAEAQVESVDDWRVCQRRLYGELREQLVKTWSHPEYREP